jgi:hypothetical protein
MPVSQASFANKTPETGSIRILVQTINSVDFIKAITISNKDLGGNNIRISLNEVESIRAALTSSIVTGVDNNNILQVESISEKSNYFFLDTTDQSVLEASGSENSVIGISPFLTQPFFYNNYNALLSNASEPRPAVNKFDVDRVSGFVHPSNYTAIAGIGELDFTDLKFNNNNLVRSATSINQSTWNTNNFTLSGSITTTQTFRGDKNVTVRVDNTNIEDAVGIIQSPVILMKPEFFEDPSAYASINSFLNIEIDNTSSFDSSNLITASLATQTYVNGTIEHSTTPFSTFISSGSLGDDIYVRLHQKNLVVSANKGNTTSEQSEITINSFFYTKPQLSKLLEVRQYYDQQDPYAPLAQVQDSNYTTTGHTNARYNGTKTTEDDYSGIEPFLSATPVQGATYRIDEDDNFICSQSLGDREVEDFLFLGSGNVPTLATSDLGFITSNNQVTSTSGSVANVIVDEHDQSFNMTVNIGLNNKMIKIKPGNVLLLTDPNNGNTEVVQVLNNLHVANANPPYSTSLTTVELQVKRRFDGATTTHSFPTNTIVEAFTDTRIFRLEGSRLIAVDEKKIWIKDNRTILKTNNSGYVISLSTTCSV